MGAQNMKLTQAEQDQQEFIELLQSLKKNDPDGFPALCAKVKTILTGEAKSNG